MNNTTINILGLDWADQVAVVGEYDQAERNERKTLTHRPLITQKDRKQWTKTCSCVWYVIVGRGREKRDFECLMHGRQSSGTVCVVQVPVSRVRPSPGFVLSGLVRSSGSPRIRIRSVDPSDRSRAISTTSSSTSTCPRYGRGCLLRTLVHTCKYTCRLGQMKTKEGACRTGPCYTMSSWIGIPFPRGPKANFGDHRNRYSLLHQMYLQASFSFQPGSNELGPNSPSPLPPKEMSKRIDANGRQGRSRDSSVEANHHPRGENLHINSTKCHVMMQLELSLISLHYTKRPRPKNPDDEHVSGGLLCRAWTRLTDCVAPMVRCLPVVAAGLGVSHSRMQLSGCGNRGK